MGFNEAITYFRNKVHKADNNSLENLHSDLPKIIITDTLLLTTLGQWMGVLPDSVKIGGNGTYVITHLFANELIKKGNISRDDFELVNKKFANIIKMAGFGQGNTCKLYNFDNKNLAFDCMFEETGEIAKMKISLGDYWENLPSLCIDFDGIKIVYEYLSENEDRPDKLYIQHVTKDIDDKDKKFYHFVSQFSYYGDVYDSENKVSVKIDYPNILEMDRNTNPYVDEKKMEEALSSITFPVNIEELCHIVSNSLLGEVNDFKNISITVKKMNGMKEGNVTDQAEFSNGYLVKLIITRDGKKITLTNFEEWAYNTDRYTVSQTNDKNVSYGFRDVSINDLDTIPTPQEMISTASEEVEKVRILAKTLLQPKKKNTE
ncbi:MAG: hypothetical protein ACI4XM_03225 [Candidatus Coprovivens sp.]